jgi:broad specificity phosphatase PhoE
MTTVRAGSDAEPALGNSSDIENDTNSEAADRTAFVHGELTSDTQLWIVRHGETEWSVSGQHTGVTDIPLTPNGEKQAAALRSVLAGVDPVLVLSSPRRRALHTAELAGIHVDEITDDLAEWNYGDYEGLTSKTIHEQVPGWTVWTHGCPGGESTSDVRARADRVLTRVATHLAEGPVILFGHGHFSRALGARWIGMPIVGGANLLLGTAAPSLLGADHSAPAIVHWNMTNPAT